MRRKRVDGFVMVLKIVVKILILVVILLPNFL